MDLGDGPNREHPAPRELRDLPAALSWWPDAHTRGAFLSFVLGEHPALAGLRPA
jgi:hypothetical protein